MQVETGPPHSAEAVLQEMLASAAPAEVQQAARALQQLWQLQARRPMPLPLLQLLPGGEWDSGVCRELVQRHLLFRRKAITQGSMVQVSK